VKVVDIIAATSKVLFIASFESYCLHIRFTALILAGSSVVYCLD
jgi:hypothetical protein